MIRIAAVIEALGRGGAERLLVDTARLLDRSRFCMAVYTLFPVRRDYENQLRAAGINEVCLGLREHGDVVRGALRLRAQFARERPDVVHTHLFAANLAGRLAARMVGRPVISTIHGADYEPSVRLGNPGLTLPKQLLLQAGDAMTLAISRARVVAVSHYAAASVRRRLGVDSSRVEVIHNAVDTDVFLPDPSRRNEARRALGLGPESPTLICVGRMAPEKGQDILLRAIPELLAKFPRLRLLLVGDGACRDGNERLARSLKVQDTVSFLGARWDVADLLRAADVAVMPSLNEGFGLVMAEALASGTPVVASRMGPTAEVVRDSETGLLVRPRDPSALAAAVARLLGDRGLCRQMGRRGREDALARFSLPTMVGRLQSFYERVHEDEFDSRTR